MEETDLEKGLDTKRNQPERLLLERRKRSHQRLLMLGGDRDRICTMKFEKPWVVLS
jgi:hypothetical protein